MAVCDFEPVDPSVGVLVSCVQNGSKIHSITQ